MKIGLKLYSTDVDLVPDTLKLREESLFNYIELYSIPGSYEKTIETWKSLDCPFIIHAPHSLHGINFAQPGLWENNKRNFVETQLFADSLGSDIIIAHGGNNGFFDETLRQLALLNESRIALENKPKIGVNGEICVGCSPDELHEAIDSGIVRQIVLDFGHAVCAANSLNIEAMEIIQGFLKFDPKVFHLSDGNASSEQDTHFNLGKGNLDIAWFLATIPEGGFLTLETPRDTLAGLNDFITDVQYLNNLNMSH